jgi:hypothetical protein
MSRNCNHRNAPFTRNERRHPLQAFSAGLEVIRSDVQHALRIRHIRIDADDRDALCHRLVNFRLENLGPRCGEADSSRVLFQDLAEHYQFCAWCVRRRTNKFTFYSERFGRVRKPLAPPASRAG